MVYSTGRRSSASPLLVACRRAPQTLAGRCAPWMRRRMARMFRDAAAATLDAGTRLLDELRRLLEDT